MKQKLFFLLIIFFVKHSFAQDGHARMAFVENKGQWDSKVKFKADIPDGALFCESDGLTFVMEDPNTKHLHSHKDEVKSRMEAPLRKKMHAFQMKFKSPKNVVFETTNPSKSFSNYYLGNDSKKWASNVHKFEKLSYKEIYEGIDFVIYPNVDGVKYDYIVHPKGNISNLILEYKGADNLRLRNNKLEIKTSVNTVTEVIPKAYQIINNDTVLVKCEFELKNNVVSFNFPNGCNKTVDVVIDPVLIFASYSGSVADNFGFTATYDDKGYLYAGGIAFDIGYPTTIGAYDVSFNGGIEDVVISKYDTTGNFMVYSTYIGGTGVELPHSLIVNKTNELLIYGTTGSSDFPTSATAYKKTFSGGTYYQINNDNQSYDNGSDVFISKLSADGGTLLASTYFGGTGNDGLNSIPNLRVNYADEVRGEINIDENNNIYVGSVTQSADLPISANAFQPSFGGGGEDGFIVKFDANLSNVLWCSYFGGDGLDAIYSLKINPKRNAITVAGGTNSLNIPVSTTAVQKTNAGGRADGFIVNISDNGTAILNSTYYGSSSYDQIYMVDVDRMSNIYIFGQTQAPGNTFIKNALWNTPGAGQLLSKFSPNLDTVIWSTVFGKPTGVPDISPAAFMVDVCNKIYLTGWGGYVNDLSGCIGGNTFNMPITPDAFQSATDGSDFYLMVMNDDASNIVYGSYIGGNQSPEHVDGGTSRFDKKGRVYQSVCAGCWGRSDFPTNTVMNVNNAIHCNNGWGGCNNAVFKFDFKLPLVVANFDLPKISCAPVNVTFKNTSQGDSTCHWDFGDGTTSVVRSPSHSYSNPGNYKITLIAYSPIACNYSDTISKTLLVLSNNPDVLPEKLLCSGASVQIGYAPTSDTSVHYTWSPAVGLSDIHASNPVASPTATTTYSVNVSNGVCSANVNQVVRLYKLITKDSIRNISCNGLCNGWLKVIPSGGVGNYSYQWSNSISQDTNTHLCKGSYTVTITDEQNCMDIQTLSISQPDTIKISVLDTVMLKCNGTCYGHINISVQSGTPPYSFLWNSGQNTQNIINICAGDYIVTVTDANHCKNDLLVKIRDTSNFTVTLNAKNDISCFSLCDGSATVIAGSGVPPYTYLWSNGNPTNQISNVCAGNYNVVVSDSKNCIVSVFVPINQPASLQMHVDSKKGPSCFGYNNGSVNLSAIGGTPKYTYNWNNQNVDSVQTGLSIGKYYITITDSHNCKAKDSVVLQQPTPLILDMHSGKTTCATSCDGSGWGIPSGGTRKYTYQWSNGAGDSLTSHLCAGINSLTVTDANNCQIIGNVIIVAGSYVLNVTATAEKDSVFVTDDIKLHALPANGCVYQWLPSDLFVNANLANPIAHTLGNTDFTVFVTDSIGCSNKATVSVKIREYSCSNPFVFVPNAFSPDGDGNNDVLYVRGKIISQLYFVIYDRWGEKVFETRDINLGWDGIYKDKAADPGVFVYYLEVTCVDNQKYFQKGNITLIR